MSADEPGSPGRRTWILVALGAVIVVLVVILIGITIADGRAADSSTSSAWYPIVMHAGLG